MKNYTSAVTATELQVAQRIRRFEERLLELFSQGLLNGTVHTCIGQEFGAISVLRNFETGDWVTSNHRGHGHFLAVTGDFDGLMAEIMGRSAGVCGGIGGSQHLFANGFISNGIQGGMAPIAVGMSLALKIQSHSSVVFAFIGDGTLGEGALYEALNVSSLQQAPVVWIVENNGYAQSTNTSKTIAGTLRGRADAFGIRYFEGNIWDLEQLFDEAAQAVNFARVTRSPVLLNIQSYRLKAHSKGDDNRDSREVESYWKKDPLVKMQELSPNEFAESDKAALRTIDEAVNFAKNSSPCEYAPSKISPKSHNFVPVEFIAERCVQQIYNGLKLAMEADGALSIWGEDIEGPYGGAFKVTRDLSLLFPGRVTNMPIAESAIVGLATGLALQGRTSIAEIMFGDFMTLVLDQLYQHAAKFSAMFNGSVQVPLVVRTPMGGRRGYGPTHSQSIEKHFFGISGLTVIAINHRMNLEKFYSALLHSVQSPHLIIENKILYTRRGDQPLPKGYFAVTSDGKYPVIKLCPPTAADITLICYGGMLEEVEAALSVLLWEHEIAAEVICPSRLSPPDMEDIVISVKKTGRFLSVEEGSATAGFGAIVASALFERSVSASGATLGYEGIIPANYDREVELLCGRERIVQEVRRIVSGNTSAALSS